MRRLARKLDQFMCFLFKLNWKLDFHLTACQLSMVASEAPLELLGAYHNLAPNGKGMQTN